MEFGYKKYFLIIPMLLFPCFVKASVLQEKWNFETSATTQTGINGSTLISSQANAVSTDVPFVGNSNKLTADGNHRLLGATNYFPFSTSGFSFNFWLKDYDHSSSTDSYLYFAPNYYQSGTSTLFSWDFGGQMIFGCIHNWTCTTVYNTITASDYYALGSKNYWHMFSVNIASDYYEIFLDGVSKVKKTFSTHVWDGAIMSYNDLSAQSNYLLIDELTEYSGLLSQSQINNLYYGNTLPSVFLSFDFPLNGGSVKDFTNWAINYNVDRWYPKLRLIVDYWDDVIEYTDSEVVPAQTASTTWQIAKPHALTDNHTYHAKAQLQSLSNCDPMLISCDIVILSETATTTFDIDNFSGDTYDNAIFGNEAFTDLTFSTSSVNFLGGLSPHDFACEADEWADTSWWTQLRCKVAEDTIQIGITFANFFIKLFGLANSSLTVIFPFDIPMHIKKSWQDAETAPFPSSLSYFDVVDGSGNLHMTFPSSWNGTGSDGNYVVFGHDVFLTNSNLVAFFSAVRTFTTFLFWFMLTFAIIRKGRNFFNDELNL